MMQAAPQAASWLGHPLLPGAGQRHVTPCRQPSPPPCPLPAAPPAGEQPQQHPASGSWRPQSPVATRGCREAQAPAASWEGRPGAPNPRGGPANVPSPVAPGSPRAGQLTALRPVISWHPPPAAVGRELSRSPSPRSTLPPANAPLHAVGQPCGSPRSSEPLQAAGPVRGGEPTARALEGARSASQPRVRAQVGLAGISWQPSPPQSQAQSPRPARPSPPPHALQAGLQIRSDTPRQPDQAALSPCFGARPVSPEPQQQQAPPGPAPVTPGMPGWGGAASHTALPRRAPEQYPPMSASASLLPAWHPQPPAAGPRPVHQVPAEGPASYQPVGSPLQATQEPWDLLSTPIAANAVWQGYGRPPPVPEALRERRGSQAGLQRAPSQAGDSSPWQGASATTTAAPNTPSAAPVTSTPPPSSRTAWGDPLPSPLLAGILQADAGCCLGTCGSSSVSASLRTTMGHFGIPEPPPEGAQPGLCGPLVEEDPTLMDRSLDVGGHQSVEQDEVQGEDREDELELVAPELRTPIHHADERELARPTPVHAPSDSGAEESAATSFVMRSSPFQAMTPSRRAPAQARMQDLARARPQEESTAATVCGPAWLQTGEDVPEEPLDLSLSRQVPQAAVCRHRGSQSAMPALQAPEEPKDPTVEPELGAPAGAFSDAAEMEEKKASPGHAGHPVPGNAADDTDADYGEPVQPLRPRTRALPGNNAQVSPGDPGVAGNSIEKKPPVPTDKQNYDSGVVAPARPTGSPLSGTSLTVREAAAEVSLRDLAELRSFRNPPAVVCQVLEAVAVILGVDDVRWARMRKLLDKDFVTKIRAFDPTSATQAQAERLAVLLQVPTFSDGLLGERCPAVLSLAAWCNAVGRHLEAPLPSTAPPPMPLPSGRNSKREAKPQIMGGSLEVPGALTRPDLGGLEVEPDLWSLTEEELVRVSELRVSRPGVGTVTFHGTTDCRNLVGRRRLTDIIILNPGEVVVYPNQSTKPPVGVALNKPASIALYGCLPKAQGFRDRRARERYKKRVRQMTEDKGAEFVDYDCDEGVWQFRVAHF